MLFLHLLRWSCCFWLFVCQCGVWRWLICICWTILVSLGWIPPGHGVRSFWYVVGFGWLKFWEFLCPYSSKILAYSFLFWWYLCLILELGWRWRHRMSLGVFLLLQPFGKFREDVYKFLFVCLVEFTCETIWSWTFICRECFYDIFNFISSDQSVQLIYFFLIQFWQAVSL